MMHMLVADIDAWWYQINKSEVVKSTMLSFGQLNFNHGKCETFVYPIHLVFFGVLVKM
jgi:hypothetical protein